MGQVSRFQEKQQNRRQKAIFNIAFTLVLVTVGIVTYQLFTPSNTSTKAIAQEKKVTKIEEKKAEDKEAAQLEEKSKAEKSVKTNGTENNEEEKTASQEKGSQTNPSWKPIGTEQGAKPEMKFKEGTVDWSEMKKAISYAVDVPESQLIFDFIGNNGNNKAYGNVRDKQNNKKYKVNIDWVENQGWKPVSVQVVR
ncbi:MULTISPECIES: YrrS family protein [Bacillus cereus group]|uniref:YrrS family protein n=1 Tax=Bacillus cereus group TaxID=86661 RepID=UPI000BECA824|nr:MULTISPECIES: YrrS family protein [Bacillus cereus group]PDY67469.1 FMN-dependent NADH-azoreductase [Bacillus cereus]PDY74108.1 FMN-dependent NADH-azoreductase [Bacillus cereus]PEA98675.1 FMN-dependent NADH-azoreductase [Bacillus cereus]PEC32451.1 FMN-dependent NADH-azoreductase [Bacillus cereus]PEC90857.1 FMN-dependent NADH-azoreductase [Bacillus cereus]